MIKSFVLLTAFISQFAFAGRPIDADSIRSTDHTKVWTPPAATDTLVGRASTDTLTNKTLSGNTAVTLISGSGTLTLPTSGSVIVPNGADTLVNLTGSQTLTNKVLSGNTAVSLISGSGTLTLNTTGTITVPNATDTLVGKATTDTLTNKSISGSTNTITNVSLTTGVTGTLPLGNGGTGQTTKAPAFDALSPMSASGDIIYGGVSGTGTALVKGSNGTYLSLVAGLPAWSAVVAPAGTLSGTTLNATVVSSSLTSVGTIATGVWSGTAVALAKGGTGQTTKAPAFDALQPMSASGDIIYGGTSGTGTRLAKGSDGQYLKLVSGLPAWAAGASGAASLAVSAKTTTYTTTTADDLITFSSAGGAYTITLVTAVGNTGKVFYFKKTDTNANLVTIDANSTETIDGALTYKMATANDQLAIVSDGANWKILSRNITVSAIYKSTGITVANGAVILYDTKIEDTHSLYATGTGLFTATAETAGLYMVGWTCTSVARQIQCALQKNATNYATALYTVGATAAAQGTALVRLASGDTLDVINANGSTEQMNATTTDNRFEILRIAN